MIGLPTLGKVSMRWAIAHRGIRSPMNCAVGELIEQGRPVDIARNRIVKLAIEMKDPTHVLFIDDDVLVHPHCLIQLLKNDVDIVSGVYFSKGDASEPLIFNEPGYGTMEYVPGTGLHKVWGHGMGLTLIKMDVFRRMSETVNLGTDELGSPRWFFTEGDEPGSGRQMTEDLWFCEKANEAGFDRHVDMSWWCFGWHYCMERETAFPEEQWKQFQQGKTVTFSFSDELVPKYRELLEGYGQRNAVA